MQMNPEIFQGYKILGKRKKELSLLQAKVNLSVLCAEFKRVCGKFSDAAIKTIEKSSNSGKIPTVSEELSTL